MPGMLSNTWGLYRTAPRKMWFLRAQVSLARALIPLGDRETHQVVSADGTTLSVRRSGHGEPIVLVHGGVGGKDLAFGPVEAALRDDFTVWTYDRRGFGGSGDGDDHSLGKDVQDLVAVIESTDARPHVLGHSYGATCALRAATQGVEMRSLTVYEPPLYQQDNEDTRGAFLKAEPIEEAIAHGELDWALREFYELADLTKPEVSMLRSIRPLWKRLLDGVPVLPRELAALRSWKWQPDPASAPDFPVLLVSGEETRASLYPTIETLREALPHAEIAMIAGQRHMATAFSPWQFVEVVSRFLKSH